MEGYTLPTFQLHVADGYNFTAIARQGKRIFGTFHINVVARMNRRSHFNLAAGGSSLYIVIRVKFSAHLNLATLAGNRNIMTGIHGLVLRGVIQRDRTAVTFHADVIVSLNTGRCHLYLAAIALKTDVIRPDGGVVQLQLAAVGGDMRRLPGSDFQGGGAVVPCRTVNLNIRSRQDRIGVIHQSLGCLRHRAAGIQRAFSQYVADLVKGNITGLTVGTFPHLHSVKGHQGALVRVL